MSEVFYSNPGSDENKFQAKGRFRRLLPTDPVPVIIIDMLDPSTVGELLAKRLAAKHESLLPFLQGPSAQLTEFKAERQNEPWRPAQDASGPGR